MQKYLLTLLMLVAMTIPSVALAQVAPAGAVVGDGTQQKLRFYGLSMDFAAYDTSATNATYYYNTLDMYFLPTWAVGRLAFKGTRFERLALSGRFTLSRPLAGYDEAYFNQYADQGPLTPCSNLTTSTQGGTINPADVQRCPHNAQYRWDYSDIQLIVSNGRLFTIPGVKINFNPSIIFGLPTSLQSRFATLRLTMAAALGFSRVFFEGKLNARYTLNASKNFHEFTTTHIDAAPQQTGPRSNIGEGYFSDDAQILTFTQGAGARSQSYGFGHIFGLDISPTDALSFTIMYILRQGVPYETPDSIDYGNVKGLDGCASGQAVAGNSGSAISCDTVLRVNQIFWLSAGYQVNDWLNVSASFITASPQRKPDGSLRQPFADFGANGFSQVSFGASLSIDKVFAKLIP